MFPWTLSQFQSISLNIDQYKALSITQSLSVIFHHFSVILNPFQSLSMSLTQQKRKNVLTIGRWGKTTRNLLVQWTKAKWTHRFCGRGVRKREE